MDDDKGNQNKNRYPLYFIAWNVTYECNLSCEFCYNKNHATKGDILNTEEVKNMIKEAISLGLKTILFTGGEPLLRSDIYKLLEYAKNKGLYVCLATNGTLLDNQAIKKLKKIVDRINIGFNEINFSDTGTSQNSVSLKKLNKNIENLKETVDVSINYTVHAKNLSNLVKIAERCNHIGVELNIKRFIPIGISSGKTEFCLSFEDHEDLCDVVGKLKESGYKISFKSDPIFNVVKRNVNKFGGCLAGIHMLSIDPYGNAMLCTKLPLILSNIKKENLTKFWNHSDILKKLRNREIEGRCAKCKFLIACGGCRAATYAKTKNIFAEDPMCHIGY